MRISAFDFKSGHTKRKGGTVARAASAVGGTATLTHNELQEKLFNYLVGLYGNENIGTENLVGVAGTSIDVVRKEGENYIFYEIKTNKTIRSSIREALPQLMEYAYWPDQRRATKLIIVSPNQPTENVRKYLKNLRDNFGIPVYYQQIDPENGTLSVAV